MSNPFQNYMFQDDLLALGFPTPVNATLGGTFSFETVAAKAKIHSMIPAATQNNCWTVIKSGTLAPGSSVESYLGPLIIAKKGVPIQVKWTNNTGGAPQSPPPIKVLNHVMIDGVETVVNQVYTMDQAKWTAPDGLSMHLHGGKVLADSDGWPLLTAAPGTTQVFDYPNDQPSNLIWYHDHAMDWTARNVYAGIAGGYVIRDNFDDEIMALIPAANEIPLVFQDRQLWDEASKKLTAEMRYEIATDPNIPNPPIRAATFDPAVPSVILDVLPEFFGEFNLVNGRLWPKINLPGRDLYRLRMINGANARTYALKLMAKVGGAWCFVNDLLTVIGADGGLMGSTIPLVANEELVMAPGERRDVILDLRNLNVDIFNGVSQLYWVNVAQVPFSSNQASLPSGGATATLSTTTASLLGSSSTVENAPFHTQLQGFPQIMRFDVDMAIPMQPRPGFLSLKLPDILLRARAANTDFRYMGGLGWRPMPGRNFGPNRLFLIDNNPMPMQVGGQNSSMMFLHECLRLPTTAGANMILRWDADTTTARNPFRARTVNRNVGYQIGGPMPGMEMSSDFKNALTQSAPKPDTYERWYFVNLFLNSTGPAPGQAALDMHPLHIHLVNFYLSRRWSIGKNSRSVTLVSNPGLYASLALRDTQRVRGSQTTANGVTVSSLGEIVELTVYFPLGYKQPSQAMPSGISRYPFHCHILEHEEMGMMRYFDYN